MLALKAVLGGNDLPLISAVRKYAETAAACHLGCGLSREKPPPEVILAPALGVALDTAREHLADRIWRLHHSGASYGLKIQAISLAPSKGVSHRDACLEALATA